ncbi:KamA family radical SAM protein [Methanoculleus sp. FWC-SCC1]|uniref:KamA family radical SAM protein n=1 Tax=Methanoculleus frigidifontis TaxID=2584085 RepID=A0ABT8MDD5_9EURY|nr:KamA family radical SAM protein [Methanoculleus sp. FWC-SCC1]MDN7025962.1 KamA family radical SAM protein [Methanoculleus sp. FWC-SCC1]
MAGPTYITDIRKVVQIPAAERERLADVARKFAFRANDYYLSLIDWSDPDDPLRKIAVPDPEELAEWGSLDASAESAYVVAPGMEHKYDQTVLLLASDLCAGYCRYCFRKRLFMHRTDEVARDVSADIDYISRDPEITNVLISGGDPLFLATPRLERIVRQVRRIEHVKIVRIGTKVPAFNPYRILDDPALPAMLSRYSTPEKRIYIMTQFNHPRELTDPAVRALDALQNAGAVLANQTPLLRGVNDDPVVLADLFRSLSFVGAAPYYLFQCRPTLGNRHFAVPVEEGYRIYEQAKSRCSGLAKRSVFAMSHRTGKIAVVGLDEENIYFKYHQAARREDIGKFMVFRRCPKAVWFDDYTDIVREGRISDAEEKEEIRPPPLPA